jgi:hypothetical protein
MPQDPIVAEIHRVRERMWRECHGSAEEMADRQRRVQKECAGRLIDPAEWKRRRRRLARKAR